MIFSLVDGRADAWQWDTGLSLNVDTSEHQISEVHMSNSSTKGAFVCEIKPDRTVEIPNILLTTDGDINIYAIISDEEGERTVIKERLHVHRKKKPQDYVYTETEVYDYKDYIARLAAVENTVVRAGAVYTLPPDEEADVNIRVITNEDGSLTYYIDFYIPEGQQGKPGDPGRPGNPGANGKTPYIQNGYWYIDGVNLGVRAEGTQGNPGASITITRITESTESGGTNTVEFSDGNRLNVRNGNDGEDGEGGGGVIVETDPTVPDWAKQPNKPSYTASEVGALPASTKIPTKMSELDNDSEYVQLDDLSPYAKKKDIPSVPTKVSELANDSGFITKAVSDLTNYYLKSETLTKTEINALVSAIPKFTISVVSSLPTSNISETTVYLVKSGSGGDLYTEYIRVNNAWEILGSQKVDLTGYAKLTDIPTKMSELENDSDYAQLDDFADWAKQTNKPEYTAEEVGAVSTDALPEAINDALAQAKASGEFDGDDGEDGSHFWTTATAPTTPNYTFSIGNLSGDSNASVKPGDIIFYSYYRYTVKTVSGSTVLCSPRQSIRGTQGAAGADGVSPTVTISKSGTVTTITITDKNGTKTAKINDGTNGTSVTVSNVSESTASGGTNTVTFSDGKKINIKNGVNGTNGKTPVKGTDYFTAADKAEMVNSVKESIEENGLVIGDETAGNGEEATRISKNYIVLTMDGEGAYMTSEGKGNISFYDSDSDDNVILSNIAEPDGYYDAANKGYVDSKTTDKAETWTFTLANGSTVTKKVVLG